MISKALVIGMGEVGRRLARALRQAGVEIVPVTREAGWEAAAASTPEPRLVCVGEAQLPPVLERLREVSPSALVFVQNGWVRDHLAGAGGATRGLIWFMSKGDFFRVLRASPFSGPLAAPLAAALEAGGIAAVAIDEPAFRSAEAEKMGFNCLVGLPLAVHRVSLAEYLQRHHAEAEALFEEATTVTARALGVAPSPAWWPEMLRLAEPLGWVRSAAPKALEHRNAAVLALARQLGVAVPVTERLLAAAGWTGGSTSTGLSSLT